MVGQSTKGSKKGLVPGIEVLLLFLGTLAGRRSHHAFGEGEAGQFQSCVKSQFLQGVVDMALYRMKCNIELPGDLFIAHSPGNEINDLMFAPGQLDRPHQTVGLPTMNGVFYNVREKRTGQ
jgi:hypothetical protein